MLSLPLSDLGTITDLCTVERDPGMTILNQSLLVDA
jgi:hypothetical protein